jgi:biopolymer transport protein ExbB/TolQ
MTKNERKIKIRRKSDAFVKWIGSTRSLLIHTVFFAIMLCLAFSDIGFDKVMLVLTTIVSLEAIYLSIFIQMTVNRHGEELEEVSEDIEEIQEDVEEIQKDVDEIQEDVDEIQEDVEEIQEEDENEELEEKKDDELMQKIEDSLGKLIEEVVELKKQSATKKAKAKSDKNKNSNSKKTSKQQYSPKK